MNSNISSTSLFIKQFQTQHRTRENGDKVMTRGTGGLYDLFSGEGWGNHSKFRIVRWRDKTKAPQLIQVEGTPLSRDYRDILLKELS